MKCPACGDNMRHRDKQGVEIDVCQRCGGVWLDASEFDEILGVDGDRSVEAALQELCPSVWSCRHCGEPLKGQQTCSGCGEISQLSCPRDQSELQVVDALGVELDRCPSCSGLWVDGFERAKLASMRDKLRGQAVAVGADDGGDAAMVMGMMLAGGMAGGDAFTDAMGGFGMAEEGAAQGDDAPSAAADDAAVMTREAESLGGTRSMREYIEKHGGFQIECNECGAELTRYSAWERDGGYICLGCAEETMDPGLVRAMQYREPVSTEEYWHDEGHLVEVLKWMVGAVLPKKS